MRLHLYRDHFSYAHTSGLGVLLVVNTACVYSTRVVLSWSEEKTNRFGEAASPKSKIQVSAGLLRASGDRITATGERQEVRHRTVHHETLIRDTAPKKRGRSSWQALKNLESSIS